MNKILVRILMIVMLQGFVTAHAQRDSLRFQIAFYNTENLFDPQDDSTKNDDAFTPEGMNHWSYTRLRRKINNIAKVFVAMGEPEPPDIIGLAEIENDYVLRQLCYHSPLERFGYSIIHYDSPDARGIDVALLYRKEHVHILYSKAIPIVFPFEPKSRNRDILYCRALLDNRDTVHLFVNHWTSRYSGYAATIPKRNYYAQVLRHHTDSILQANPNAAIVIMGDFNDYPTDESLRHILAARSPKEGESPSRLINLMMEFNNLQNQGTHKHEDFWGCLDQLIVSESLMDQQQRCHIEEKRAVIFKADFMVVPDEKYGGEKVFRTFLGPRYIGGYADHLPVFLWLRCQE
jgi:predicted extracellular nuclease